MSEFPIKMFMEEVLSISFPILLKNTYFHFGSLVKKRKPFHCFHIQVEYLIHQQIFFKYV